MGLRAGLASAPRYSLGANGTRAPPWPSILATTSITAADRKPDGVVLPLFVGVGLDDDVGDQVNNV
ncbi:MAG: hypothetical protein JWR37_6199 [Mycobacterium sp.]|jgi:hypothetical protein|nr:hypothetical protein [Mycobacterium sp.]